jgi:hypothetical protein
LSSMPRPSILNSLDSCSSDDSSSCSGNSSSSSDSNSSSNSSIGSGSNCYSSSGGGSNDSCDDSNATVTSSLSSYHLCCRRGGPSRGRCHPREEGRNHGDDKTAMMKEEEAEDRRLQWWQHRGNGPASIPPSPLGWTIGFWQSMISEAAGAPSSSQWVPSPSSPSSPPLYLSPLPLFGGGGRGQCLEDVQEAVPIRSPAALAAATLAAPPPHCSPFVRASNDGHGGGV